MCQGVLQDPAFFKFLLCIDQDRAAAVRALGCPCCSGPLHVGDFKRKPRGPLRDPLVSTIRLSFSCGHCRVRCMPASVRFLGRRVYWGAWVLLATALCSGLSLRRGRQLTQQLSVPVLTLLRWRPLSAAAWISSRLDGLKTVRQLLADAGLEARLGDRWLPACLAPIVDAWLRREIVWSD